MNPVRGGRPRLAGIGYDPCSGSGLITSSVVDGAAVYPACCVLKFRCHFVAYKVLQSIGWTERLSPRAPGSEVGGELGVSFRSVGMRLPAGTSIKETTMSPLRARMIEDMTLAGLAVGTQKIYIQAVRRLAAHCRRSPDELGEEEVRGYLLGLRQRGVARGTFKTGQYGLRFLYRHTLGRDRLLFGEKKDRLATAEAAA